MVHEKAMAAAKVEMMRGVELKTQQDVKLKLE